MGKNMVNVFISFRETDGEYREGLEGLLQNPNAKLNHAPVSARQDYRRKGEEAIKNYLKGLIKKTDVIICLIGKETDSSDWVDYELQVGSSLGVGIVPLRIKETSGGLPQLIESKKIREASWDSSSLNTAINKAIQFTRRNKVI